MGEDEECNVIKNLDTIDISRYESYVEFLSEAKKYKEKVTYEGTKEETTSKTNNNKDFAKISNKKRAVSRKKINQATKNLVLQHREKYGQENDLENEYD